MSVDQLPQVDQLLHAVVYGDSAYPSGRYTLSNGLEGLVQTGRMAGAEQAGQALLDHLRHACAPADGLATAIAVVLADMYQAQPARQPRALELLLAADKELTATKVTDALRRGSARVGRQTLDVQARVAAQVRVRGEAQAAAQVQAQAQVAAQTQHPNEPERADLREAPGLLELYQDKVTARETDGNQALALGLIHQRRQLGAKEAVSIEMISLAIGWASAALRLRQCDHIGAQVMVEQSRQLIRELATECEAKARWVVEREDMTHIGSSSPGLDLASAAHHYAPARLFMN